MLIAPPKSEALSISTQCWGMANMLEEVHTFSIVVVCRLLRDKKQFYAKYNFQPTDFLAPYPLSHLCSFVKISCHFNYALLLIKVGTISSNHTFYK